MIRTGGPRSDQARKVSRLARHNAEMRLAIAENLTLDQARERLASYEAHRPRLDGPPAQAATVPAGAPRYWWKERDLG